MGETVWVKGTRLREARKAARLKLSDVSQGIMSPANLSRIERHERYRLRLVVLVALGKRLGLALEDTTDPHTWAQAIVNNAIKRLTQWRFSEAVSVLRMRDTILRLAEPATEVRAQILGAWARAKCGDAPQSNAIHEIGLQAQRIGAMREATWAKVFEAKIHDRTGNRELALTTLSHSVTGVDRMVGETVDVLCTRAAWARLLLKDGQLNRALEALQEVADIVELTPGYGQARFLHASGSLHSASGRLEEAEFALSQAATVAARIPNYRMTAMIEHTLARVYQSRADTGKAGATLLQAASSFSRAGDSDAAAEMISKALRLHLPWTVKVQIAGRGTKGAGLGDHGQANGTCAPQKTGFAIESPSMQ